MERIIEFLEKNGYQKLDTNDDSDYISMFKDGVSAIDIDIDEIIFIGDTGDWLHIPCNLYALIGALLYHRELAIGFKV